MLKLVKFYQTQKADFTIQININDNKFISRKA